MAAVFIALRLVWDPRWRSLYSVHSLWRLHRCPLFLPICQSLEHYHRRYVLACWILSSSVVWSTFVATQRCLPPVLQVIKYSRCSISGSPCVQWWVSPPLLSLPLFWSSLLVILNHRLQHPVDNELLGLAKFKSIAGWALSDMFWWVGRCRARSVDYP